MSHTYIRVSRGKDLAINWPVLVNNQPADLAGLDLSLVRYEPNGKEVSMQFTVEDGVIATVFRGRHQTQLGNYRFRLWANRKQNGETHYDFPELFTLVRWEWEENIPQGSGVNVVTLNLSTGNILIGAAGQDADIEAAERAIENANKMANKASVLADEAKTQATAAFEASEIAKGQASNANMAATRAIQAALLAENNVADVASLKGSVADKLSELEQEVASKSSSYKDKSSISTRTILSDCVLLAEKSPIDIKVTENIPFTILGRNRFNLATALFKPQNNTALQTFTKENNGLVITKSEFPESNTGSYAYIDYIAEIDGELYVSCVANTSDNVRNLAMMVQLQKHGTNTFVKQQRVYGRGLLYESVNVETGDTIRVCFYSNMGAIARDACVLRYENIMFAYGGLHDYMPYVGDVNNYAYAMDEYSLPTELSSWTSQSTIESGKQRSILNDASIIPSEYLPATKDTLADIEVQGIPLVSYNQTYNKVRGLGVANDGRISVYLNGGGRNELVEYLATNSIVIKYKSGTEIIIDNNFLHNYQQGEIIVCDETISVSYEYTKQEKTISCVCLGDSITGMFTNKTDYPSMIDYNSNIKTTNAGFAGCPWTDHPTARYKPFSLIRLVDAICSGDWTEQDNALPLVVDDKPEYAERLTALKDVDFSKVDYITILHGLNDWGFSSCWLSDTDEGAPSENKERLIYENAIEYTIDRLLTTYPNLRIILLSPYLGALSSMGEMGGANAKGKYLSEFSQMVIEKANKYNLLSIDLFHTLGVNQYNTYFYTYDGGHPTEWSKHSIARKINNVIYLDGAKK